MGGGIGALIFILLLPIIIYYANKNQKKKLEDYEKIPTLEEYTTQNPECKIKNGFKCNNCGSRSIKNWGVDSFNDKKRSHICNQCSTTLYRTWA